MGVVTQWGRLLFGSDLLWVADNWNSPVSVGNGTAEFYYRRRDEDLFWIVELVIGTSTVLPSGQWFFELPADALAASSGAYPGIAAGAGFVSQQKSPFVHATALAELYQSAGSPSGVAMSMWAPNAINFLGGSGALTKLYPFAWAAGDFCFFGGSGRAFGN